MGWFKKKSKSKPKQRGPPKEVIRRNDWLKSQLRSLKRKFNNATKNIKNMNNEIRHKQGDIRAMEREIGNLNKSINNNSHRYNSAKNLIKQYNGEIKTLQAEKKKLDKEIINLNKEIASLTEIISRVDNGSIELESELDMLLEEHNKIKGILLDNDEKYFDLLTVQNDHLNREYDYLKNDLTKGDQASTFVQPNIKNWELANHFLKMSYYVFALLLLLFLYKYFSMKKLYITSIIILLVGLYPFYIIHLERFVYDNVMYMGKFLTATPVK